MEVRVQAGGQLVDRGEPKGAGRERLPMEWGHGEVVWRIGGSRHVREKDGEMRNRECGFEVREGPPRLTHSTNS